LQLASLLASAHIYFNNADRKLRMHLWYRKLRMHLWYGKHIEEIIMHMK
jgi:hypothetical protein